MRFFITILMFFAMALPALAQEQSSSLTEEQIAAYEERVKQLVSFLQFSMNTLGDANTPTRDKQVIINESYLKAFRDDKVQIEDDLAEKRETVTNKDVQAYLKDIDFFFKQVTFTLEVENVEHYIGSDGQFFFRVTMNRNLDGVTVGDKTISTNQPRFIEINLNQEENDLKIVSIYTTKLSEEEELKNWWKGISYEWAAYFKSRFKLFQEPEFNDLKKIARIDSVNLEGNKFIVDLSALGKLSELKYLNISNTTISDFTPIRNNTKLKVLEMANAPVRKLKNLKYATQLRELNVSGSQVVDFDYLETFKGLKKLNCAGTTLGKSAYLKELSQLEYLNASNAGLTELKSFGSLTKLKELDISGNAVSDISSLSILTLLKKININNTTVSDLEALKNVKKLKLLYANDTKITNLLPLEGIKSLERVYADNSGLTAEAANKFMMAHGKALVVSGSQNLENWWKGISTDWKNILSKHAKVTINPTKEELVSITNLDKLDFSGNQYVTSLEPLGQLWNLTELRFSGTLVNDLAPLQNFHTLKIIECANSKVSALTAINKLEGLTKLNIDNCPINDERIALYQSKHPDCLVIFRSTALKNWWYDMSKNWRKIFINEVGANKEPTSEQLHKMAALEQLEITNNQDIKDLTPLSELKGLRKLKIIGTRVSNLLPLVDLKKLESLDCSSNPISNLSAIKNLKTLRSLNISNTPVEDLDAMSYMLKLEHLECSGTQIKSLKPIKNLFSLKYLDINNTSVSSLNHIEDLRKIKTLICYNTRLSSKKVGSFKKAHPRSEVTYY